jgi:pectate lyase
VFAQSITVSANASAVLNNYFNLISNYNICTESSAKVYNRTNCHAGAKQDDNQLDSASNKISGCETPNQVRGNKGRIFKKSLYNHLDIYAKTLL